MTTKNYVKPMADGRRHPIVGLWALAADKAPRLPRPGRRTDATTTTLFDT